MEGALDCAMIILFERDYKTLYLLWWTYSIECLMGGFLSEIQGKQVSVDSQLLNSSHSKLVEYYSSYKSICEGYTINVPEYTHIFGPNQLSFEVWDKKRRGKIDAIEMFTGLIIFSTIGFEQKMKFLFQVFDFNEEGFLQFENIALMLINACNATYKIYALSITVSNSAVEQFLDQYFTQESQVTYQQLIRWALRVPEIGKYFRSIGHHIDEIEQQKRIAQVNHEHLSQTVAKNKKVYLSQRELTIDSTFMSRMQSFFDRNKPESKEKMREMLNLQVEWVYGINVKRQNIKFLCHEGLKAASQRIIYTVGKLIIIYFPKINIQHYYKEHNQSISVIDISKGSTLIASGEEGEYPQIHVWDINSRKNFTKFKRLHKDSIKFLKFFKNDKQLITASESSMLFHSKIQTPLVIINLQTQQIIMNTYLQSEILGIGFNDEFPLKLSDFFAVSHNQVTFFSQQKDAYQLYSESIMINKPIVHFAYSPRGLLVTCHSERKLYSWNQKFICNPILYVSEYQAQAKEIAFLGEQQLLLLDDNDVEVLRFENNMVSRVYTLKLRDNRLFNLNLFHFEKTQENGLLVLSEFGDLFKIESLDLLEKPSFQKYYQFFRLLSPRDYCRISDSKIAVASGNCIYIMDRYERQLCTLARMDWQIQRVESCANKLIVLGIIDEKNKILASLNPIDCRIKETFKLASQKVLIATNDNYLLAFQENSLTVFHRIQDSFFEKKPHVYNISFEVPMTVSHAADKQIFILVNQLKQVWKFTLGSHSHVDVKKIEKNGQPLFYQLSGEYHSDGYHYPYCANLSRKLFAAAENKGDIMIWDSMSQAISHRSEALQLKFHCGKVAKLIIKDEQMVSLGEEDGMIVLFKHKSYIQGSDSQPFLEEVDKSSQILIESLVQSRQVYKSEESMNVGVKTKMDELGSNYLKESQVEIQPLQEDQQSDLKKIIREIINPKDKVTYQTQMQQDQLNGYNNLNLNISAAYGLSTKSSSSVFYSHSYSRQPLSLIPLDRQKSVRSSTHQSQTQNEDFNFSKALLVPLDESHLGCSRKFIYATDRICVLRQRGKDSKQKIYDFHRRKVTCIAIHPDRQIIISCEESPQFPTIHVWQIDKMATKSIITTRHSQRITRANFSRDGAWLVTLGGKEKEQSIQIVSWRDEQQIAFRLCEGQVLRDIVFNPYERRQVSVVGWQVIKVYTYTAGTLILTDQCKTIHDFQAVCYTSNVYGNSIESDLIIGNSTGDLGIFICGKFILTKEHAHSAAICCLRIAELFGYKRILITGGADSVVKIWDIKFNQLTQKKIQQQLYSYKANGEDRPECRITSLDVYQCLKGQGVDRAPTLLLISSSDGSVLEATIHNEFQGYQTRSLATREVHQLKEKINFDISLLFSNPFALPSTNFDIFNTTMVTFNPQSPFLQFWSLQSGQICLVFKLPELPCVVRFMSSAPFLIVAYKNLSINYFSIFEALFETPILKNLRYAAEVPLNKGHGQPVSATFASSDNRLALVCSQNQGSSVYLFSKQEEQKQMLVFKGKIESSLTASFLDFSASGEALLVAWTDPKRSTTIEQDYTVKCYRSQNQEQTPLLRFDFKKFDFSKKIKASYLPCSQLARVQQDLPSKYAVKITTMAQYDEHLLLGTQNGEVLVIPAAFFMRRSSEERCFVRNFILCDSPIKSLLVRDSMMYVSSELGEGIMCIQLNLQQHWNLPKIIHDPHCDNSTAESLNTKIKHVYSKRRKMRTEQDIDYRGQERQWLRLAGIVGRSAFTKRNNIFVDLKDSIIFYSGCNILINKYHPGHKLEQIVLKPDPNPHSIHPQISSMALAEDKRLLIVGTAEENSKLLLWNISTNTYLHQIPLSGFVSVSIIKISLSVRVATVVAVTAEAARHLLYVDLYSQRVIGVYRLVEMSLNDICFAGAEQHRVVGCGPNYMGEWIFRNGILSPRRYSLGSQDILDFKNQNIVFYSLIYLQDMAISSGSDGFLYIWREGKLAKRQNAHPGHQVLSLYSSPNSRIFASGGTNGRVVIWKFWSNLIIQHQGEYPKEGNLKYPVQSVSMTREHVIVGDTSGSIIQFPFFVQQGSGYQTLLAPFDHEMIISCAFSTDSKKLYVVTSLGTFAIFDTVTFERLREEKLEFKSQLVRMLVCRLANRIFLVMKHSIAENSVMGEGKEGGKILKFSRSLKCEPGIKTAAMSSQENYLAVLVAQSSLHNSKIEIYNLTAPDTHFYKIYKIEENIPASIDLIDFCVDHDYLLYQGPDEEQTIIDLMTREKIKLSTIESHLEWAEEAKKTSPYLADITALYSEENRLLRLVQVMNKCLVATDQMGSVRVFVKGLLSQVCIEHLNEVYICVVSPFNRLLVTVGKEDRAMHFWEIIDRS